MRKEAASKTDAPVTPATPVTPAAPVTPAEREKTENYTYVLLCGDGSLYTGWTNRLEQRVKAHQSGTGAKYTKSHAPVELIYYEVYPTQVEAMQREAYIKKLTRKKKDQLLSGEFTEDREWNRLSYWKKEE